MQTEIVARKAQVSFDWADGTYTFALPIGQLVELQEKCDAGPAWIYARLQTDTWRVEDLIETIRLGLIGGKQVNPDQARTLVRRYVEQRPLGESVDPALKILSAVLLGVPDEPPKKDVGERTGIRTRRSLKEKSASPASTE